MRHLTTLSIMLIMLTCLVGCRTDKDDKKQEPIAPLVKYIVVGDKEGLKPRRYPGRVKANKEVALAFQVSGQLIDLPVKEGDVITKGQLLATLDPRDFQNTLDIESAELNKASQQYKRTLELVERGTISKADHDKATAEFEIAKARVATAKKALEDTQLRAPFSGRIATKYIDNFQNVKAEEPVLSLQDISYVDIEFNVPERDFLNAKASPDAKVTPRHKVMIDALPNRTFPVVLKSFRTQAEEDTQTFQITVTMKAPEDVSILPGMSATFLYLAHLREEGTALSLPIQCVQVDENGAHYVWIIDEIELTVKKQIILVGSPSGESVQINSELAPGTHIVAAGFDQLSEGQAVRLWHNKAQ